MLSSRFILSSGFAILKAVTSSIDERDRWEGGGTDAELRMGFEKGRLLPRYSDGKAVRSAGQEALAEISELTPYINDDSDCRVQNSPSAVQLEAHARWLAIILCFGLRACGELA